MFVEIFCPPRKRPGLKDSSSASEDKRLTSRAGHRSPSLSCTETAFSLLSSFYKKGKKLSDWVILEKKRCMAIQKLSEPYQCSKKLSWGDDVTHYTMIAAVIWDFPIQKRFHHRQVSISERLQP